MNPSTLLQALILSALLASAANADDKVFVGYLYGPSKNLNYKLYTHLCHAFAVADGDGTLHKGRNVPSKELTSEAHKNGVKVLISLGGFGWDKQFAEIISKPQAEERYVKAVMEIVKTYDYDGIDFDWEYPDTEKEIVGFERICRRFRKDLDAIGKPNGRPMFLTFAASSNPGTLRWLKTEFLVETLDWINVMTYDYAGDWTDFAGHNSPLFDSSRQPGKIKRSTATSINYLLNERHVPPNKIALGLPLYGRAFAVKEPYASTKGVAKTRLPQGNYRNIHDLLNDKTWTRKWDEETKTPWLISNDKPIVIGYDDAESMRLKTEWAARQNLRGVFFWQVTADRLADGTNPLQEASHKAWGQK